jgi:phosphatidate cytidylyltransferase
MIEPGPAPSGKWADLRTRILSAIVMVAVGAVEIWLGGTAFAALVVALTGVMIWELATMTAPQHRRSPVTLAVAASAALVAALVLRTEVAALFLAVPSVALLMTPRRDRRLAGAYALAIMLAGYGLIDLRETGGTTVILWLVAVVVVSDVLGYFAGRTIGGPKFWERVSPKKTWSGTIAGWIGAALVGLAVMLTTGGSWLLIPLSALVAFAGQMGDIAESWVKRRAGVKDASNLIPGHGGVLDRFDALIGAVVAVLALGLLVPVTGLLGG